MARFHRHVPFSDDIRHPCGNVTRFRVLPISMASPAPGAPWPDSSRWACWNCMQTFATIPVMIPRSDGAGADAMDVFGNFCSVACALRYLDDNRTSLTSGFRTWLLLVAARHWGMDVASLRSAPSRLALLAFGGRMDATTFRALVAPTVPTSFLGPRPRVMSTPTCVREQYFGGLEHGRGEDGILAALADAFRALRVGEGTVDGGTPPALPPRFVLRWAGRSVTSWPDNSPFLCWNCGLGICGRPVLAPSGPRTPQGLLTLDGNYCSVGCAMRDVLDSRDPARAERLGCMMMLARTLYGVTLERARFPVAPSRLERDLLGGDLSDDEHRAQATLADMFTSVEFPPLLNVLGEGTVVRPDVAVVDMTRLGTGEAVDEERAAADDVATQPGLFEKYLRELKLVPADGAQ